MLNTINQTANVLCSPTISINGISNLCAGSASTLTATGANNYTWTPGFSTTSQIIVSPTVSTCYSVTGSNASGCIGQASSCVTLQPFSSAGFTHTLNNNGNVTFTSTSTPTTALSSYTWNFGNTTSTVLTNNTTSASTNYTTNGLYTVTLSFSSGTLCPAVATATSLINVNTVSCSLLAGFTYTQGLSGFVSFNNTSTGTISGVSYTWHFGDNTFAFISSPTHSYSANGTYTVKLIASNNFTNTCMDSISIPVTINSYSPCNLVANFSITATANNAASFTSTSSGTVSGSTYIWNYGDGSNGIGATSSHTYMNSGPYIATLTVNNNYTPTCSSTKTLAVSVSSICNVLANYTHTVSSLGQVLFNSSSSTISPHTKYYWNFGDGIYSTGVNPSHTYNNAGTYLVTLRLTDTLNVCKDTLTQSINVTGIPCIANSNFTLVPSGTPQSWNAIPAYPWNVTSAIWSWGDGTTYTTGLYTSHLYSVSAMYTICLSVTVSCGANSTSCSSYSVFRSSETGGSDIISINVIPPAMSTGIVNTRSESIYSSLYPNPNEGVFTFAINGIYEKETLITVYNLVGETLYTLKSESLDGTLTEQIALENISNGIYFLQVSSGSNTFTRKIVISK